MLGGLILNVLFTVAFKIEHRYIVLMSVTL